jgi:hypothetical protein
MSKDVQKEFLEILFSRHGSSEGMEMFKNLLEEKRFVVEAWS